MISHNDLIKTPEYWMETIQNELYRQVKKYLDDNDMNQTEFADQLKVTRGYISQILNGNFNYTLSKLISLSLAMGITPDLHFRSFDEYLFREQRRQMEGSLNLASNKNMSIPVGPKEFIPSASINGKVYSINKGEIPPFNPQLKVA